MRAIALLALMLATACLVLPGGGPAAAQDEVDVVDIVFTEIERRIIREYYERLYRDWYEGKGKKHDMPPGLARRSTLPPGLAERIVRNGTLPPGLAKRLPYDLVVRLPARPDWQDIVIVDDKVLLIRRATNLILDIILVVAAEAG